MTNDSSFASTSHTFATGRSDRDIRTAASPSSNGTTVAAQVNVAPHVAQPHQQVLLPAPPPAPMTLQPMLLGGQIVYCAVPQPQPGVNMAQFVPAAPVGGYVPTGFVNGSAAPPSAPGALQYFFDPATGAVTAAAFATSAAGASPQHPFMTVAAPYAPPQPQVAFPTYMYTVAAPNVMPQVGGYAVAYHAAPPSYSFSGATQGFQVPLSHVGIMAPPRFNPPPAPSQPSVISGRTAAPPPAADMMMGAGGKTDSTHSNRSATKSKPSPTNNSAGGKAPVQPTAAELQALAEARETRKQRLCALVDAVTAVAPPLHFFKRDASKAAGLDVTRPLPLESPPSALADACMAIFDFLASLADPAAAAAADTAAVSSQAITDGDLMDLMKTVLPVHVALHLRDVMYHHCRQRCGAMSFDLTGAHWAAEVAAAAAGLDKQREAMMATQHGCLLCTDAFQRRGTIVAALIDILARVPSPCLTCAMLHLNNAEMKFSFCPLIAVIMKHFDALTTERRGSIALLRVLTASSEASNPVSSFALFVSHRVKRLAACPHGNFLVSKLLSDFGPRQGDDPSSGDCDILMDIISASELDDGEEEDGTPNSSTGEDLRGDDEIASAHARSNEEEGTHRSTTEDSDMRYLRGGAVRESRRPCTVACLPPRELMHVYDPRRVLPPPQLNQVLFDANESRLTTAALLALTVRPTAAASDDPSSAGSSLGLRNNPTLAAPRSVIRAAASETSSTARRTGGGIRQQDDATAQALMHVAKSATIHPNIWKQLIDRLCDWLSSGFSEFARDRTASHVVEACILHFPFVSHDGARRWLAELFATPQRCEQLASLSTHATGHFAVLSVFHMLRYRNDWILQAPQPSLGPHSTNVTVTTSTTSEVASSSSAAVPSLTADELRRTVRAGLHHLALCDTYQRSEFFSKLEACRPKV